MNKFSQVILKVTLISFYFNQAFPANDDQWLEVPQKRRWSLWWWIMWAALEIRGFPRMSWVQDNCQDDFNDCCVTNRGGKDQVIAKSLANAGTPSTPLAPGVATARLSRRPGSYLDSPEYQSSQAAALSADSFDFTQMRCVIDIFNMHRIYVLKMMYFIGP